MSKVCTSRGYSLFPIPACKVLHPFRRSAGKHDEKVTKVVAYTTEDTSTQETEAWSEVSSTTCPSKTKEQQEMDLDMIQCEVTSAQRPHEPLCQSATGGSAGALRLQMGAVPADEGSQCAWQPPCADGEDVMNLRQVGEEAPDGLAVVLDSMARLAPHTGARTVFHATKACPIGICDYMKRLRTYFSCSIECYVLALVYIDRAIKEEPRLVPDARSVHRLALTGLLLAAKFQDDVFYSNRFYSQVGGVTVKELNGLEIVMLRILKHRLYVNLEEFAVYHNMVSQAASAKQATQLSQA